MKTWSESDPFLNSALQRFTCELYCRISSFIASLSVGLIMSRPYLSEKTVADNKNGRWTNSSITKTSNNKRPEEICSG